MRYYCRALPNGYRTETAKHVGPMYQPVAYHRQSFFQIYGQRDVII